MTCSAITDLFIYNHQTPFIMITKPRFVQLIVMSAFLMVAACSPPHEELTISNPLALFRVDEPVVISRADLETNYGLIPAGMLPLLVSAAGDTIPVQHDDINGDGQWDELFFLATLEPSVSKVFRLVYLNMADIPVFEHRTNVRFARIQEETYVPLVRGTRLTAEEGLAGGVFQMEGPAWENDRVGFRNYFDVRNGMDIFGKTVPDMVLDRVGIDEDYHVMQPWGMDILRVGPSLGAGSLAIEKDDELIRVGPDAEGSYELIVHGPMRSVFRLRFDNWAVDGQVISLVHDIEIVGGAWYYTSHVTLGNASANIRPVTGITTIDLEQKVASEFVEASRVVTVATHGNQAYDFEKLGLAIMLDYDSYQGYDHTPDQSEMPNTFVVRMDATAPQPLAFRFYSCWEVSEPRFAEETYFLDFLKTEALKKAFPLEVVLN